MNTSSNCALWPQPSWQPKEESILKLSLLIREEDDVIIVHCRGRITYREEAAALSETVAELLPHARQLVLDLSCVEMIDSAGLGELVGLFTLAGSRGCSLQLAGPGRHIRSLLELTNLVSVFEIHSTVEEAVLALGRSVA